MKNRQSPSYDLPLLIVFSACATALPARTIEPAAQPDVKAASQTPNDDADFVLSREARAEPKMPEYAPIHVAELWWKFRADNLNLNVTQAQERDAAVTESEPPNAFWDDQTALEAVSIWGSLCNECHGGRRRVEDVADMPKPPPLWGRTDGLFFGNRRAYAEIFRTIYNGGAIRDGKRSRMPVWRGRLSKEQIWALIYFLEYQSGGIEGRFPPSLYPRSPASGR